VNFTSFLPAISREVRRWRIHLRTGRSFAEIAQRINPIVRGWMLEPYS
jgi:RNA-directed DNA polymerase